MSNARELAELGGSYGTGGFVGMKNRIINGGMVIDQRNAGASVSGNGVYTLDRYYAQASVNSKYTVQQNAGSVTPPAGFNNYLGVTSSSAYTVGAGENYGIAQVIEGYNVADLGWGASGASTVTLSFWVRSSLTGTFGGSLQNSAVNRSYPFSYTISAANTWEFKTITVAGDTTGTWLKTNGQGLLVWISIGAGASVSGTAGSWAAANYVSATGATSVVGTNGATFYITGVQLEKGSTATSFDFRSYGTELALCQRYFELIYSDAAGEAIFSAPWQSSYRWVWQMKVQKRTNCAFGLLGSGNWQVATPNINGGTTNVGAYHSSSTYYLQGTPNTAVGYATAEL